MCFVSICSMWLPSRRPLPVTRPLLGKDKNNNKKTFVCHRTQRMGWMEKRHDGLRVVGGNDFRVRCRQEFHRIVRVFEQRLPSKRTSELISVHKTFVLLTSSFFVFTIGFFFYSTHWTRARQRIQRLVSGVSPIVFLINNIQVMFRTPYLITYP
jgi:hypothetical protein